MSETDWMADALCAETDPDIFTPDHGQGVGPAKRVCAQCEVANMCLGWALQNEPGFGIYGGLTFGERRKLRRAA